MLILFFTAAPTSSPNMDLGSIALGTLESDVIQAQKMARVLARTYILTRHNKSMNLIGTKLDKERKNKICRICEQECPLLSQILLRWTKLDLCKTSRLMVHEDVRDGLVLSSLNNMVLAAMLHL